MEFHVSLTGRGDLAADVYRQLREAILDGRLRPGERLPPTRELARRLAVSRNTVAAAYDRLTAEGFLVGRVGAGTFVCTQSLGRVRSRRAPTGGVRPRPVWSDIPLRPLAEGLPPAYDFRPGIPDARLFPLESWRRLVNRELRAPAPYAANYGEPAGHPGLRAAVARHVGVARSVRAAAADVVVTQGAQQAIDLVGRVLVEPGDCVAVEEPGYLPARHLFRSQGARVVGVPVDGEGLDVAALPENTRLVYVTPSHQYPLGVPMSLARRSALLEWARRHDAVVVEDDYDSEFRFADRPLEPLQSLDRHGRVVYVGSFAKTMLPVLRLGFLVAPAALLPALRTAKQLADWHGDYTTQAAMAGFIEDGLLARHIRRANREYAARHERVGAVLRRDFADWLSIVPSAAGLHVCARLVAGARADVDAVVRRAAEDGVAMDSLAGLYADRPAQAGLVIGYGGIAVDRIDEGLARLATSFRETAGR
ncbi:MAG TPA: PLP-dependent aminotransferase family protein [Micromonosporaceae bacterium]|nr:PLP-dependent aminotransferase family protein [Micromonosporaceae bacterium]